MAHCSLVPEDGGYLEPEEIVVRLKAEFSNVDASRQQGRKSVMQRIAYLQKLKSEDRRPFGTDLQQQILYLEARISKAIDIAICDEDAPGDAVLHASLLPDDAIVFGYYSQANQDAATPLLERVKRVLGYQEDE